MYRMTICNVTFSDSVSSVLGPAFWSCMVPWWSKLLITLEPPCVCVCVVSGKCAFYSSSHIVFSYALFSSSLRQCRRGWGAVMECIHYPTHPASSPDWKTQQSRDTTGDWNALFNWQALSKHLRAYPLLGNFFFFQKCSQNHLLTWKSVNSSLPVLVLQLLFLYHVLWRLSLGTVCDKCSDRRKEGGEGESERERNRLIPQPRGEIQHYFCTHSPLILHAPWGQ